MKEPSRYSASSAAVNASFFRISGTLNELRMVESTAAPRGLGVDDLAGAAGGLDLLAGGLGESVGVHGERLGQLTAAEHLDRDPLAGRQAGAAQRVEIDRGAAFEARLEVIE